MCVSYSPETDNLESFTSWEIQNCLTLSRQQQHIRSSPVFPIGKRCVFGQLLLRSWAEVSCQSLVCWCAQLHWCDSGQFSWGWWVKSTSQEHSLCWREALVSCSLKASCCLELKHSGKPCCCQDVNWELLQCCPCFLQADTGGGMYSTSMRGPFPWLLQWIKKKWFSTGVTIENPYFSDYRRIIQMISKYTPLFLVLSHEAILPLLSQTPWCFFFFWHSDMNSCTAIKYLNSCIWD